MDSFPGGFLNQPILWLAALAAIPVILHFLLRHKPKKLVFPALRLIQLRKKNNVRRLRLKHIWLLLLRILVIVLLVLAIARPTLPGTANYWPNLTETLTLIGIVLVAAAVYFTVLSFWRRRQLPRHVYTYRRSLMRYATGLGVAVLMLLAFVWPYTNRVFAEIHAPLPEVARDQPVASVFLFDTTLSMGYQEENESRLEAAVEIATRHVRQFPTGSQIAVTSTSGSERVLFQSDVVAAAERMERLKVDPLSRRRLDDLLRAAVAKQKSDRAESLEKIDADRYLREIYIFTDLTKSGWSESPSQGLRQELADSPWLQVYVIDVGVKEPTNVAVTGVTLSEQSVVQSAPLDVVVKLKATGQERVDRELTLSFLDGTGRKITKGQAAVAVEPGMEVTHKFTLGALSGPFRQAEVRIDSTDPLEADDVRYFTVAVHPQPRVLIVSDSRSDAFLWRQSLAPDELLESEQWFRCTYLQATKLASTDLSRYDAVYLINVSRPTDEMWKTLRGYVQSGGGVGIAMGIPFSPEVMKTYNSPQAREILPAHVLGKPPAFKPPEFLDLTQSSHPMFAMLVKHDNDLTSVPVRQYWRVRPVGRAKTLARFTNVRRSPALLVRSVGRGRTLMLTTAVNRRENWNDLWAAEWAYVELAHKMTQFLVGRASRSYNFQQGDSVRLYWDRRISARPEMLRKPHTQVSVGSKDAPDRDAEDSKSLAVRRELLDEVGNYQLLGDDENAQILAAFSYNVAPAQSDLTRLRIEDLDEVFGPNRYQLAGDTESLKRAYQLGRLGKEVFDFVLACMLLVFCGEHFVANRFYESDQSAVHQ